VECLRTLDRLRLVEDLGEEAIAISREAIFHLMEGLGVIELTHPVLARAAQPQPTNLRTFDAIHLAPDINVERASRRKSGHGYP